MAQKRSGGGPAKKPKALWSSATDWGKGGGMNVPGGNQKAVRKLKQWDRAMSQKNRGIKWARRHG